MTAVTVRGIGSWRGGGPSGDAPDDRALGAQRRRATLLSRMLVEVAGQALSARSLSEVAVVLVSVGGELDNTFANLALLAGDPPSSSPLRFGNSVHNAALGHMAIASGNRHFASAVAARPAHALAIGLIEGWACAATGSEDVLVVWAEEAWPLGEGAAAEPAAAAVHLSGQPQPGLGTLRGFRRAAMAPAGVTPADRGPPLADVLAFVAALADRPPGPIGLGDGWEVEWTR